MADLDLNKIVQDMLAAAATAVGPDFDQAKDFAGREFARLAEAVAKIQRSCLLGEMGESEALVLMDMQMKAAESVLLAVRGMGAVAAQKALRAAVTAVAETVNGAVGFRLL